jgi:hypothetical protein
MVKTLEERMQADWFGGLIDGWFLSWKMGRAESLLGRCSSTQRTRGSCEWPE